MSQQRARSGSPAVGTLICYHITPWPRGIWHCTVEKSYNASGHGHLPNQQCKCISFSKKGSSIVIKKHQRSFKVFSRPLKTVCDLSPACVLQHIQSAFKLEFQIFRSQAFQDIPVIAVSYTHWLFGTALWKKKKINKAGLLSQVLVAFVSHVCNIRGMMQRWDVLYAVRF